VEFFTVKAFSMDSRLEASQSPIHSPDRRASLGIESLAKKQRLSGSILRAVSSHSKLAAGVRFELTTFVNSLYLALIRICDGFPAMSHSVIHASVRARNSRPTAKVPSGRARQ